VGGVMTRLITRNTAIPTSRTEIFTTGQDNQSAVDIHVVQGEREMAVDNRSLGRFVLSGIPPAMRGVPKIAVTFEIDANGIVHVSAKDNATNQARRVTVQASGGLSRDEVEKMVEEAAAHADADRQKRERQEAINAADMLLYGAFRTLREAEKKGGVDVALIAASREALHALRQALSEENTTLTQLKERTDKATDALYALSSELYRSDNSSSLLDMDELPPKAAESDEDILKPLPTHKPESIVTNRS